MEKYDGYEIDITYKEEVGKEKTKRILAEAYSLTEYSFYFTYENGGIHAENPFTEKYVYEKKIEEKIIQIDMTYVKKIVIEPRLHGPSCRNTEIKVGKDGQLEFDIK